MRISPVVVAHTSRDIQAKQLASQLNDCPITLDDGTLGAGRNHLKAWILANTHPDTTHCLVVEDDAIPVDDIHTQMMEALTVAPSPVVSFYTGINRPPQWQIPIQAALGQNTEWLCCDEVLHAVALCIRADLIPDMCQTVENIRLPIDQAIGKWTRLRGIPVSYTNPSLFNHADGEPVITHRHDGQPRVAPRVAHRFGSRNRWGSTITWMKR